MIPAALLLVLALAGAPVAPAPDARAAAREALGRLSDEDVDGARAVLAPFASAEPKSETSAARCASSVSRR